MTCGGERGYKTAGMGYDVAVTRWWNSWLGYELRCGGTKVRKQLTGFVDVARTRWRNSWLGCVVGVVSEVTIYGRHLGLIWDLERRRKVEDEGFWVRGRRKRALQRKTCRWRRAGIQKLRSIGGLEVYRSHFSAAAVTTSFFLYLNKKSVRYLQSFWKPFPSCR